MIKQMDGGVTAAQGFQAAGAAAGIKYENRKDMAGAREGKDVQWEWTKRG